MDEIIAAKSEYEQLKEKLRRLRAEVSALTAERDELRLRECPRIKAEYNARIGALELRVFDAGNRVLTLRRAVEILQAARNRQEKKSAKEASDQARKEYEAYEEDLKRKAQDVHQSSEYRQREEEQERRWREEQEKEAEQAKEKDAEQNPTNGEESGRGSAQGDESAEEEYRQNGQSRRSGQGQKAIGENIGTDGAERKTESNRTGTGGEGKRFKTRAEELHYYYRLLVKRLHPDANPELTEEEAELLRQTMEAYQNGDLDKLKEIYQKLKDSRPEADFKDTPEDIEEMKKIIASLKEKRSALKAEIQSIRNSYPYKWKDFLANEEAVAVRQKELANLLGMYQKQYQELLVRFENLKNGQNPA